MPDSADTAQPEASALRLERQLAVQYAIAGAFANAEGLGDVAAQLLRTLVGTLGWESASLWLPDEAGGVLRCAAVYPTDGPLAGWAERTLAFRPGIGEGLPGRVWASGESHWISDTERDANFPRQAAARAAGLRHGYAFAIRVRGVVHAVIELFAADVREMDVHEADFLGAVAHQLGSFLERIEARRALEGSDARKTAILQAAVDAIVVADADGRIVDFNPAAVTLFGRSFDEVVGGRIADLLVPASLRPDHEAGLRRYIETGQSRILGRRVRTWAARADGSEVPVELTVTALHVEGRPMFTAFVRDVTRERQSEIARDRFLEILSHELRTPVTSIYGGAKVAGRPGLGIEQRAELLSDIAAEADHLFRLVEDLIVLARAERGADAISLEPVSLDRVAERVVATIAAAWPELEFRFQPSPGGHPVLADQTYVEQLLRNLLTNAAKYAHSGRVVEVEVEHADGESTVRVLDRGPGVDEPELARLFEIDYRSPLTESLAHGSGIGLFVARWLAEAMGGRIWGMPRPGGGSIFGFALPSASDREPGSAPVEPSMASTLSVLEIPHMSGA
jgi:PAS domain S-box-containing protein